MLYFVLLAALLGGGGIEGTVRASGTGAPIGDAEVRILALDRAARTGADGGFTLVGVPSGRWRVQATALGYEPYEVAVRVPAEGTVRLDIELRAHVPALSPVRVEAPRAANPREVEARALFEREPLPGVTSSTREEIRSLPTIVEPDVLRALQALPGVTAPNEFDAQLYVRGGAPDQSLFVLDGARVFSPHHLFGMAGVFNADAVERVELFRGAMPARYGGALSAVVAIDQDAGADSARVSGGVSLMGVRATVRGGFPRALGNWMLAGRRTHVDLAIGERMPYAFFDVQARASLTPSAAHRVTASYLATGDRFELFFGGADEALHSRWQNGVGSLRWGWMGSGGWSTSSVLWGSRYVGDVRVGALEAAVSTSRVTAGGARLEGVRGGFRAGVDVELGRTTLEAPESQGGYLSGSATRDYLLPALYVEGDRSRGRLRLSPGLRLLYDVRAGKLLPEPRLAARLRLTERHAVTLALTRGHQMLSTLRDERTTLPGAPFWFAHPDGAPTSRTDGLSADVDSWLGGGWSVRLGTYARRFTDVPHWRPVGVRDLASVSYDDGSAIGGELSLRRYGERVSGWIGYTVSRVRFTDAVTGRPYMAAWDRRHSANAALMLRPAPRLQLSVRADYGSGRPFWPFAGDVVSPRLEPFRGTLESSDLVPLWGEEQYLLPSYFRADLGARTHVTLWGARVEPYLNLQNLTRRRNVIFYRLLGGPRPDQQPPAPPQLFPITSYGIPLPTFGFDVRF